MTRRSPDGLTAAKLPLPLSNREWQRFQRVRTIATLLDNAIEIPILRYRVGLDPLIGLLPIGGDIVGFLLSIYLVVESARLGMPAPLLTRMSLNIALETLAGSVPALGDLVDVAWKANAQNLQLLEAHLNSPNRGPIRVSKRFVVLLMGGLLALTIAAAGVSLWLLNWAIHAIAGS